jgi:hypothetical protein
MTGTLSAAVDAATRRSGGFALGWSAGTDFDPATSGTRACDHYEIRRAATGVTTEAAWSAATVVAASVGSGLTATKVTTGRLPSTTNFAIRCYDKAANAGPIVATSSAATADFITSTLTGPAGLATFGYDVSSGLDLTGDAIPDLVVAGLGKVCVYFGHRPASATDPGFASTPDVCFVGSSLGSSVSELSDFDGDGLNDLAIGAALDGKTWLVSGAAITASATDVAVSGLGTKSIVYAGDATTAIFGAKVRNVSGFFGGTARGALLIRSKVGGLFSTLVVKSHPFDGSTVSMPANADFFAQTNSTTSALALSVAAQDVDGDGLTDFLVGDYLKGSVYLFKGRSAFSATVVPVSAADGVLTSATPSDRFGYSVGLPGKITGTRFDAVIGAPLGVGYAEVDKISGTTLTRSARMTHPAAGEQLGLSTVMLHPGQTFDVDGDGIADVLTCSETPTASSSGCFLVYGSATLADHDVSVSAPDVKFFGVDTTGSYGTNVHAVGDIDADGFVDWAMCSPNSSVCTIVR